MNVLGENWRRGHRKMSLGFISGLQGTNCCRSSRLLLIWRRGFSEGLSLSLSFSLTFSLSLLLARALSPSPARSFCLLCLCLSLSVCLSVSVSLPTPPSSSLESQLSVYFVYLFKQNLYLHHAWVFLPLQRCWSKFCHINIHKHLK